MKVCFSFYKLLLFVIVGQLCLVSVAQQRDINDVLNIIETRGNKLLGHRAIDALKSKSFSQKANAIVPASDIKSLNPTANASGAEAFYVYNADGDNGFIIVSGDERMSPVLAYSNQGNLNLDSLPDNAKAWLLAYIGEAKSLDSQTQTLNKQYVKSDDYLAPLLSTQWGQSFPYNALCPYYAEGRQAVTGCVATSMAQAMNYYRFPTSGTGSHSYTTATHHISMSKDFSATTFKWDLLKNSYQADGNTEEEVEAIADLMLTCGVSVDMDYDSESGSSNTDNMNALAKYFGYDNDMYIAHKDFMTENEWHNLLLSELDSYRPLMFSAETPKGYGHAFIIDGYQADEGDYPFYHVNWGWKGNADGFFKMNNMNDGQDVDDNYILNVSTIANFMPDNNKEDNACFLQIRSLKPNSNTIDLGTGEKLTLKLDTLMNGSNKTFNGKIKFCLSDAGNTKATIYTFAVSDVKTSYFASMESIQCNIPNSLDDGQYTLEVYACPDGSDTESRVSCGNNPITIALTNNKNFFYPSIMATEVEVASSGKNSFQMSATNLCNMGDVTFNGVVQMLITDNNDKTIATFGNKVNINNLNTYGYLARTYDFSGTVPSDLPIGEYRLHLGAQQTGYSNWSPVEKYVIEGGYITNLGIDAYTTFWLTDSGITLDDPFGRGDVDCDGKINSADIIAIYNFIIDPSTSGVDEKRVDINGDGTVNSADVTATYNIIIGKN